MKIDKKNEHICYNDEKHVYWNEKNNDYYTSTTTVVSSYKEPFDSNFWSMYKAAERLCNFSAIKSKVLKVKGDYNAALKIILKEVSQEELDVEIKVVLEEWKTKKDVACERGTEYHLEKENEFLSKPIHIINDEVYRLATNSDLSKWNKAIFPELLLYNDKYSLAGQADVVIKNGKYITIRDYKTNEKLDVKAYQNKFTKKYKTMLYPLDNVPDCDLEHYSIQLSIYGYMIEQLGDYKVTGLYIDHIDHYGNETTHKVLYRKKDVIKLLEHERKTKLKIS